MTSLHRAKLEAARILVVGAGGLGNPVVAYLAAAGVAKITLLDPDVVQLSNLPRQVFFGISDVGHLKVEVLADRLNGLQGKPIVEPIAVELTDANAHLFLANHEVVVDCSDSLELKYVLSAHCKLLNKPWVMGAVDQWQGQILTIPDQRAATYSDFYPKTPNGAEWGSCSTNGVMGTVVGVVAAMLANAAIKIAVGLEESRKNRMIIYDGRAGECLYISHLNDTFSSKNLNAESSFGLNIMNSISNAELKLWREEGRNFQLIDVREQFEFDEFNLGGQLIPMNTVPDNVEAFSKEIPVVVHCKAGSRSANVIRFLEEQYGFTNLYNLEGGVLAAI
jgi:sulfur-carrier protein adenylyltransferase/sulfurtransferase